MFLTLCVILFSGCSQEKLSELLQGELIEPLQSEQVQQGERTDRELLIAAEKWLGKDFSFTMTYEFMNLAINDMQLAAEKALELRAWMGRFSRAFGHPVVDFYSLFEGRTDLYLDGLHPTEEGHRMMAEAVYKAIREHAGKAF